MRDLAKLEGLLEKKEQLIAEILELNKELTNVSRPESYKMYRTCVTEVHKLDKVLTRQLFERFNEG